jgi:nucleoside-diphosphate-sugar epimerase
MASPRGSENRLEEDLRGIGEAGEAVLRELAGARLFVTGGTGFVGTWLLESFAWANRALSLDATAVVLTRDPQRFATKAPHLAADPAIGLVLGDVVDFDLPAGAFTHVVHAAAESSTQQNATDPLRMADTIVRGTRRVLDAARTWDAAKVLFTSSGAVYGAQPSGIELIEEGYSGGPDQLAAGSAYAESKRFAEFTCATYAADYGVLVAIARCFAFVGPHLPLDAHFAIGNFIGDGLAGGPIVVRGDGAPIRSYLYAGDLALWLWTILLRGEPARAYNVGSEEAYSISEVAAIVASQFEAPPEVRTVGSAASPTGGGGTRYVPSTARAQGELGLKATVTLPEAVRRTIAWHRGART